MEEQQLIAEAKQGVKKSFSQLVLMHQDRLYQYLLARCRNSFDANDILQDTFINAYKYLNSYKPQWQFNTWLYTIANRLIKKQMALYNNSNEINNNEDYDELEEYKTDKNNIWNEVRKLVNQQTFDVLWFYYVEERTIKEISQIIQKSQSSVKITLFRSKKKLAINKDIIELSKEYLMLGILL